jgi:imidazolonepropionase-like amidohydrolase
MEGESCRSTSDGRRVVLAGGQVFDGVSDRPFLADVAMSGGRIVDVQLGLDGDEVVDVTGHTLLPGLFDCHVHVTVGSIDIVEMLAQPFSLQFYVAMENLQRLLSVGITMVRDAGGADLGVREAVRRGMISGPDMAIAVTTLGQTGGHTDNWYPSGVTVPAELLAHPGRPDGVVDGVDAMRRKVREVIRAGADVIKVCTTGGVLSPRDSPSHSHFSDAELAALVEEANRAGRWVMAHAQGAQGVKAAVRAGIRSIEHGIFLDEEAVSLMVERGTWLVPTLSAPLAVLKAASSGAQLPPEAEAKAREAVERHHESFRLALEAGVKIAMGTDSGVITHGTNLSELGLMHQYGMSAADVLRATTSSAADLLGLAHTRGRIEAGFLADVVVVRGDAFAFANLADSVIRVFKHGKAVDVRA